MRRKTRPKIRGIFGLRIIANRAATVWTNKKSKRRYRY